MIGWFEKGGCPKQTNVEWSFVFDIDNPWPRGYSRWQSALLRSPLLRMCSPERNVQGGINNFTLDLYVTPIYILSNLETAELYYNVTQLYIR